MAYKLLISVALALLLQVSFIQAADQDSLKNTEQLIAADIDEFHRVEIEKIELLYLLDGYYRQLSLYNAQVAAGKKDAKLEAYIKVATPEFIAKAKQFIKDEQKCLDMGTKLINAAEGIVPQISKA